MRTRIGFLALGLLLVGCGDNFVIDQPSATAAVERRCTIGHHACGDWCMPNSSVLSCGDISCTPCPATANGQAACGDGACRFICNAGFVPTSDGRCVAP